MPSIIYDTPTGPQTVIITQGEADIIIKVAYKKTSVGFVRIGNDVLNINRIQTIQAWDNGTTTVGDLISPNQ